MGGQNSPVVVIPAAGRSGRFVEQGFTAPKAALRVRDREGCEMPMLLHVIANIPTAWPVVVGTTTDQVDAYRQILGDEAVQRGVVVDVGPYTMGQADTVRRILGGDATSRGQKIMVVNCDNVFSRFDLQVLHDFLAIADMTVLVHKSRNPMCSFVDSIPIPTRFVEKEPISEWAMSGAWAFRSAKSLHQAISETMHLDRTVRGEFYLSSALNRLPGRKIVVNCTGMQDWGTPESIRETGARIVVPSRDTAAPGDRAGELDQVGGEAQ